MAACVSVPNSKTVYIVGSSGRKGQVSFAAEPKQHDQYADASREATRLANVASTTGSTATSYMVFSLVGVAKVEVTGKGF